MKSGRHRILALSIATVTTSLLVVGTVGSIVAACGTNASTCQGFDCSDELQGDAATLLDAGDAAILTAADGSIHGGPDCPARCSADLHSYVDCKGVEISKCGDNQGCIAGGKCAAPCDAAEASKSSVGCEYFVATPTPFSETCFAAFIANTWGAPVTLSVARGAQQLNIDTFAGIPRGNGKALTYAPLKGGLLPAGAVAALFLNGGSTCPAGLTTAATGAATFGTGIADTFRITASAPVVGYDIFPYGGGSSAVSSATLLLPTSSWGDNYIGLTAWPETVDGRHPWMAIIAKEDATQVTILPTVSIAGGGGVAGGSAGVSKVYTLNRGQSLKFEQAADLSGSPISATKPIGVVAGNTCAFVEATYCDGLHQQIPPIAAFGNEYVGVRYRDRVKGKTENPPWRLVGTVDGTRLTYDPPIAGAPATLNAAQVLKFKTGTPFIVRSQDDKHPFYMGGYMTGCNEVSSDGEPEGCVGDPEYVNTVPPSQHLASYTFFTDPTYPETNLVFTRHKQAGGTFADVSLDCAGTLTGWKPVGTSGQYEYTYLDMVTGNFAKVGACDNGRHDAKSAAPFGLTVWGWGSAATNPGFFSTAVSYGYPAGASFVPINTVVVPAVPK